MFGVPSMVTNGERVFVVCGAVFRVDSGISAGISLFEDGDVLFAILTMTVPKATDNVPFLTLLNQPDPADRIVVR